MSKCTPVVNKCQRRIYIGTRACPSSQIDWDLMVIHSCQNVRGRDRKMGKHIIHHTLRISRGANPRNEAFVSHTQTIYHIRNYTLSLITCAWWVGVAGSRFYLIVETRSW